MTTNLRRRSKPSPLSRLRAFWIVALAGILVLAGGGAYALNWPGFHLSALEVGGNAVVSRAEIVKRAALPTDRNIWLLDMRAAERRIERIPYVRDASVRRKFPNAIEIAVSERAPEGCLLAAGIALTIDADRRVLESGCDRLPEPLYRLPGLAAVAPGDDERSDDLGRLLRDARTLGVGPHAFVAFGYDGYGGLLATLRGGVEVRFGSDGDLPDKIRLLDAILPRPGADAGVRAIDLRAPAAPVVLRRQPQHIQDSKPGHHNI